MDKKLKRVDLADKRIDAKLIKDRGDNLRRNCNEKLKRTDVAKAFLPDRGDTVRKLSNLTDKRTLNQSKLKLSSSSYGETVEKDPVKTVIIDKPDRDIEKALQDLEERRRMKDKSSVKLKNMSVVNTMHTKDEKSLKIDGKTGVIKLQKKDNCGITGLKSKDRCIDSSNESGKSEKESCTRRKPIIRTIRNDTSVYKAVTFVDQKRPTELQITIPNDTTKKVKPKLTETVTNSLISKVKIATSKSSIKEKSVLTKKMVKRKPHISPNASLVITSPPTEVAKWVPSCINEHTKPYYEAWVNTTLAAISKNTNDEKFYAEQKELIGRFKRALERPFTPDLIYENCNDERYTGRIRVKQR